MVPFQHDGTTVDWHVKPEKNKQQQTNKEDMYTISQRSSSLRPPWCSYSPCKMGVVGLILGFPVFWMRLLNSGLLSIWPKLLVTH